MLAIRHDAQAHGGGAAGADAALAGALIHRRGRGGQRGRRAQGGCELGGGVLGQAKRADVARVQDLDGRVVPARFEAVAQNRHVDESAAVREGESACVADRDEHWLTGDLRVEELPPSAPRLQPGTAVVAARHEDAAEDAGAALRADAAESNDSRVEPAFRHGRDQERGCEFTRAGGQGQGERRGLVVDERRSEAHEGNHRASRPGGRKNRRSPVLSPGAAWASGRPYSYAARVGRSA